MSRGAETKQQILDQALAQATVVGLEGLSIGGLARDLGMSKSGLYAHFGSKEDLQLDTLELAVQEFIERVIAPALAKPRGIARVEALFAHWIEWTDHLPGGCLFIAAAQELDDRPGPVRDRLVHEQCRWLDTLERAARTAVDTGDFRPDLDTRQFAYELYAIILAAHHFHRLLQAPDTRERARRAFATLIAGAKAKPA